jgi:DNA polymerase
VPGEGPANARIVMVGEQPGDQEDLQGKPFVGPAGRILDKALAEIGADRGKVFVTNAVKHFKWEARGKRRLHKSPSGGEIAACRFWLDRELAAIKPDLVVALGATAARAVLGPAARVTRDRGKLFDTANGAKGTLTVHPSFLLRALDEDKAREYAAFVRDLRGALSG